MDERETLIYAEHIRRLHAAETELYVTLAKFVAGARMGGGGEEIR